MIFCECGHIVEEHFDKDAQDVPFQVMCQGWSMGEDSPGVTRCYCVKLRIEVR